MFNMCNIPKIVQNILKNLKEVFIEKYKACMCVFLITDIFISVDKK